MANPDSTKLASRPVQRHNRYRGRHTEHNENLDPKKLIWRNVGNRQNVDLARTKTSITKPCAPMRAAAALQLLRFHQAETWGRRCTAPNHPPPTESAEVGTELKSSLMANTGGAL